MPPSAPEATPPTGNRFVEFDEFIDYQLKKASKSIQATDILVGVVGAVLGLTVYLLAFILADHWLFPGGIGPWARLIYWTVGFAALGVWLTTRLVKPLRGRVNVLFAARQIERTQPGLKSSLLTLTDLKQAGRATSGHIRGSLEKRAAVSLSKADVDEAVDRSTLMTCSYALLFLLASFCGYALFSPKSIVQSAWRALMPFTQTTVATRTRIDRVTPGDTEVPSLSHVDVDVEISGEAPPEAMLYFTTADGAFVNEPVALRDTGEGLRRYHGTLIGPEGRGLRQNITYHVVAGDAKSQSYTVSVVQSPSAVVDEVSYQYQKYTGLAEKSEPGGAIDAWEGTRVTVSATASQKVKSAMVLFSDTENTAVKAEELPMLVSDGTKLTATWQLAFRSDGKSFPKFYRVQLKTEDGHEDPQPTLQPVNIRPDLVPKVEIVHPKSDVQAPVNGTVPIAFRASDPDFQLRSLVLNLEHDGQILASSPHLFDGPPDVESREGVHTLRLKDFNLAAGSRLTYWLEAKDNFEPFADRGINRSVSARLNIDIIEPQPPAVAQKQEQVEEEKAQDALKQAQGGEGQSAGSETSDPQNAGDTKPSNDPMPGDEPNPDPGKPGNPGDNKDTDPDGAPPSQDGAPPMPGDRPQDSDQDPKQQDPKQSGEPAQRPEGTDQSAKPQEGNQGQQKQDGSTNPGQSRPGSKTRPDGRNGSSASQQDSPSEQGSQRTPRDRAEDDTALRELIKWAEQQQKLDQQKGSEKPQDSATPNPDQKSNSDGTPGSKPTASPSRPTSDPMTPENTAPENSSNTDTKSPPGDTAAQSPKEPDKNSTGETGKPGDSPSKSAGDPMQDATAKLGDKPDADTNNSGKPGTEPKPAEAPANSPEKTAQQKTSQPGPNEAPPKPDKPAETPGEPSTSSKDEAASKDEQDKTGAKPADAAKPDARKPDEPTQEPGDASAKSPTGDQGAPGEKPMTDNEGPSKPGGTEAQSPGKTSPTGESSNQRQPGDSTSKPKDPAGNSTEKPVGQPQDMGTRSGGEGDPGSSTPADTGGQKTPGQGEPGKDGQSSATGEKSPGSAKTPSSSSASPSKEPGDAGSGDSGIAGSNTSGKSIDTPPNPAAGSEKNPSSQPPEGDSGNKNQSPKSEGSPKDSGDGKQSSGQPSSEGGGGKPPGEKPPGKPGDAPGESQTPGEKNQQPGSEKSGSGDKSGGNEKSQDGGGQQGKAGEGDSGESGSSQTSGEGQPGGKPGSQPASKSRMGGGGGSGSSPGAADPNVPAGEGASGASTTADPADLENRRKAANLALKRLEETLKRGQIDPELQKELGFTDEELRSFMDRLQERLADNGDDNSPEAQARRRQFESLLKGINLKTETTRRDGGDGAGPSTSGFGTSKRPTPNEYRAAEQKYRESLSGQKPPK